MNMNITIDNVAVAVVIVVTCAYMHAHAMHMHAYACVCVCVLRVLCAVFEVNSRHSANARMGVTLSPKLNVGPPAHRMHKELVCVCACCACYVYVGCAYVWASGLPCPSEGSNAGLSEHAQSLCARTQIQNSSNIGFMLTG